MLPRTMLALNRRALLAGAAGLGLAAADTPAQLVGDQQIKTVSGGLLRIASQGGTIAVTNPAPERQPGVFGAGGLNVAAPAAVDGPDIIATNGVIHPITQLLFP